MRIERWWWLWVFCFVSLVVHGVVGIMSPRLETPVAPAAPSEIEVALEPEQAPQPEPKKDEPKKDEPKAKDTPKPKTVAAPKRAVPFRPKDPAPVRMAKADAPKPVRLAPNVPERVPGGEDPNKEEKPLPLGLKIGRKEIAPRVQISPNDINPPTPQEAPRIARADQIAPDQLPDREPAPDGNLPLLPRRAPGDNRPSLSLDNPLSGLGNGTGGDEKPVGAERGPGAGAPKLIRAPKQPSFAGGGSPSQGPVPGGKDGFKGPEAPPEEILFSNGGGAGGKELPQGPARTGGGGGRSIVSVPNPLALDSVPDDKPGLGPGSGGGQGAGGGGGIGFARGQGIGRDPNGKFPLALSRGKSGPGIGMAKAGSGTGSRPPGGGRGTGAELPGTGGNGYGYGRGNGTGIGNGSGGGLASGGGGRGLTIAKGAGGGGGGTGGGGGGGGNGPGGRGTGRVALSRGIPFGDITGLLLGGNPNGGGGRGGGPGGRGIGVGANPRTAPPDADDPVHMVYVLDTSGSMRQGNKIGKAKLALKQALSELKPGDSFNIITFDSDARSYMPLMINVTKDNIARAMFFVDAIELRGGTNISAGLEHAFAYPRITHVFLLSDGEPSRGIRDPLEMRFYVRDLNRQKAQLITLALGLGEEFPGIQMLKALADDNNGKYTYVDLAR